MLKFFYTHPGEGASWPWWYGSGIYNNMWWSLSVTCDRSVVFSGSSGFLHQHNWPPRHNWNIVEYYIWCGFRTISLAKSVTWYTEYLMYFFHCEETRPPVSIFTYIDAMLLNLDAPVPQQTKRTFVNLSVFKNIIKFQNFQKISKFQKFQKN